MPMKTVLSIEDLTKIYRGGFQALKPINLKINAGEIFALLGPNGAGKTTLISTICGISTPTSGTVLVDGYNIISQYRKSRSLIGLVPQELTMDAFETVWNTVSFSRGLFDKPENSAFIEKILKDLSLWDKRNNRLMTLSGGMKRRVMIAKALSHEPQILFLDEPTAGVDVELRKSMWKLVHELREKGVTIVLTTHYIEEAEEMADRIGIINKGEIILVEEKNKLMKQLGTKKLIIYLVNELEEIPKSLKKFNLELKEQKLIFDYDSKQENSELFDIFQTLKNENISYYDIETRQSSLEDIFVELVRL